MLRIIKEDSEEIKFDRVANVRWQDKAYKVPFIKTLVDAFKSKEHTKRYRKETELIKNFSGIKVLKLKPELTARTVLAWKKNIPMNSATTRFIEFLRE